MRPVMRILDSAQAIVSCGRPQADRAQKSVEVGDDALVESIELVALVFSEGGIGGNWPKQPGGQRGVDAVEQFEEDDAKPVALRAKAIPSRVCPRAPWLEASTDRNAGSRVDSWSGVESKRGRGGRMAIPGGERIAAGNVREADEGMHDGEPPRMI